MWRQCHRRCHGGVIAVWVVMMKACLPSRNCLHLLLVLVSQLLVAALQSLTIDAVAKRYTDQQNNNRDGDGDVGGGVEILSEACQGRWCDRVGVIAARLVVVGARIRTSHGEDFGE